MSTPASVVANRLLASLPAVYREADRGAGHGDLQALLAAFEAVLLGTTDSAAPEGYEQRIAALPSLLSPTREAGAFAEATRDAFLPWIAARWVAFTPFAHFEPARLRRIVAGIVPLYARRGTPAYLIALLHLCFDEVAHVGLREHLSGGLRVGEGQVGRTTQLGSARPFSFGVEVQLHPRGATEHRMSALETAIRAVIDFAKPAHTDYELLVTVQGATGLGTDRSRY